MGGLLGDHPNDKERDKWLEQQAKAAEERARKAIEENPDATDISRAFTSLAAEYRGFKGLSYDVLAEQYSKELMGDVSAAVVGFAGARTPAMLRQSLETTKLEVEARNRTEGVQNQKQKPPHGNSLESEKPTVGYNVVDVNTGEVLKYGETSASPPTSRYTGAWYQRNNARMDPGTEATSKPAAKAWQSHEIRAYVERYGRLPPLNKGYQ